jgi:Ca2+-binding RTX toxin-like protein
VPGHGAAVEPLERRQMLAGHPLAGAALDEQGTLVITGTRHRDVISIAVNPADNTQLDVTLNGQTTSFDLGAVLKIRASGSSGADDIVVDGSVDRRAEQHGGKGSDLLEGGSGDDELHGGKGHDRLAGGAGDDHLFGGKGGDDLEGDDGDDSLAGEGGRDHCDGGAGSDAFDDGDEADDMDGSDDLLIPYAELPAAVRSSFESLFAGSTATEAREHHEDGVLGYELEYTTPVGVEGEVTMDASGTVLM